MDTQQVFKIGLDKYRYATLALTITQLSRKEYLKDVETFLYEFEKRVSSKLDRNVSVKISKKIKSIELTN